MINMKYTNNIIVKTIFLFFLLQTKVFAYLGMGPLIPIIGSAIVYIFLFILTIFGILWLPIRKLYQLFFKKKKIETKNIEEE